MRAITVGDLQDQFGAPYPRPILRCFICGAEYSAHAGDYFAAPADHKFRCCGRNMHRVIPIMTYGEVPA